MFREFSCGWKKDESGWRICYGGRLIMAPFRFYVGSTIENATTSARACMGLLEDVHRI